MRNSECHNRGGVVPNNPLVDYEALAREVDRIKRHRRQILRPPMLAVPAVEALRLPFRQRLKRIPVLGRLLVWLHRRWRVVRDPNVRPAQRVRAVPFVGDLIYLAWIVRDLPRFRNATALAIEAHARDLDNLRGELASRAAGIEARLAGLESAVGVLEQRFPDMESRIGQRIDAFVLETEQRLDGLASQTGQRFEGVEAGLDQYRQSVEADRQQAHGWQRMAEERLSNQNQAVRVLERRLAEAAAPVSGAPALATGTPADDLGNLYPEFESRFRGTHDSIKERQRPYLPYVTSAVAGVDRPRCVDIGCGRGEWLELLVEQGLSPEGIDLDPGMVLSCRDKGLNAIQGDGIAWLSGQPDNSIDLISAFQVVEHLPFPDLVRLLDVVLRVLAPGGVGIFETPNPENLIVGACNFYYDPTHRHPLPPPMLAFVAEQRGFVRAEILRLNAYPESMHLRGQDGEVGEVAERLNHLLYGPQDYALIVGKRHAG